MYKDRRKWIGKQLAERPFISLDELFKQFPDVSQMTLRRDLDYFEKLGEAIKVRGGARSAKFITEHSDNPYAQRLSVNMQAKIAIAKKAAEYLEPGRSIFIDSGSTIQQLIPFIDNEHYTFTTTSPLTALELCRLGKGTVNLVGGRLDRDYQAVYGQQAMHFLSEVNVDIAVLCPSGFSIESGFTGGNYGECELKRTVVKKARKVIMLLDSSKLDKSLPYTFCNTGDIDVLICEKPVTEKINKELCHNDVELVICH